jgi:hypothetical protein
MVELALKYGSARQARVQWIRIHGPLNAPSKGAITYNLNKFREKKSVKNQVYPRKNMSL